MNLSSVNICRQFNLECPPKEKSKIDSRQLIKQVNLKPAVLSRPPTVPQPSSADYKTQDKRKSLPIYSFREKILQTIDSQRIILIQGSTGSGKTTQIPQYILEDANARNQPCRILCTQPRRISAIASCERVCYERNEATGGTIGYQIRLESKLHPDTNCIFLTPGVFLRYLMSGKPEKLFNNITHILIDEAHERAKENDFLLTSIKEHFNANPNLRLIIMSATMDTAVFANYFGGCETIAIATKQFDVEEIYLEEILKRVNFRTRRVDELNEMYRTGKLVAASQSAYVNERAGGASTEALDDDTIAYLNEVLESLTTSDNPEAEFDQFAYLVQAENIPVDFRHTSTNMTALMIAVGRGCFSSVDSLLKLHADPSLKVLFAGAELSCLDIAYRLHGGDSDIKKLLQYHLDNSKPKELSTSDAYNNALLNIYYDTVLTTKSNNFIVEEGIDHELITSLVEKIHTTTPIDGAILVFLPGYDDIIQVSNMIADRLTNDHTLFLLHSSMKTEDQKNVFKSVYDRRKIILSTNIAESSITINDVVYVIDSGREKQKSYDAISHSSALQVQWISKASANQRRGRAGRLRNGVVFRVYSSDRYHSMLETTIPELLRTSLTEICLQTKLMVGDTMRIEEFLQKCIASPSIASIRQSIKFLQCLGALDQEESLTLLGSHLAEMPVDAKYAKMLIYGIALKCLNPVLSIVSILSMGDQIFVLPIKPADRFRCHQVRRTLGENSVSDHFVMLKIFQLWSSLKRNNMNERKFCDDNFISAIAMERVKGIRGQISSYLMSSGLIKAGMNVLNMNAGKWSVIKACLCAGLYPNVARIDRIRKSMYSDIDRKLVFHMSSILSNKNERSMDFVKNLPADWCVFEEKNRVGRTAMIRCNTLINSFSLSLSAGASLNSEILSTFGDWSDEDDSANEGQLVFKIDNLVTFITEKESGEFIIDLRERLDEFILRFLSSRNFTYEPNDELLVSTVASLIEIEDTNSGFVNMNLSNESMPMNVNQPRMQQNGNARSQQARGPRQNNFNNLPAGPSRNQQSSFNQQQPRYQPSNQRQKFFVMKMNNERMIQEWATKITFDIEQLNLSQWFMNRLSHPSMVKKHFMKFSNIFLTNFPSQSSSQIFIIFYSTTRSEFLGFGDIMPSKSRNQQPHFHFRLFRKLSMTELRQKFIFRNFNIFENATFQTEELSAEIGSALIDVLKL